MTSFDAEIRYIVARVEEATDKERERSRWMKTSQDKEKQIASR